MAVHQFDWMAFHHSVVAVQPLQLSIWTLVLPLRTFVSVTVSWFKPYTSTTMHITDLLGSGSFHSSTLLSSFLMHLTSIRLQSAPKTSINIAWEKQAWLFMAKGSLVCSDNKQMYNFIPIIDQLVDKKIFSNKVHRDIATAHV